MAKSALLIGLIGIGCSTQSPEPTAEARALGIDHYTVKRAPTSLVIEGLDDTGVVIGRATLTIGRFTMQEDGDVVDGRQLDIDVAGKFTHHESRGFGQLSLPLAAREPEIRTFLLDPIVASPLSDAGVGFNVTGQPVAARPAETPYDLNCSDPYWLTATTSEPYANSGGCTYGSNCASNSCGQFDKGGGEYGEFVCCFSNGTAVERACTSPDSSSGCGGTGAQGCAPCWTDIQNGCQLISGSYWQMHYCTL